MRRPLLVAALILAPLVAGAAPPRVAPHAGRQTVAPGAIHVHDGDTFYVGAEAYRLRGIDTPELGQPHADSARERLRALLRSGPVTIVRRAEDVYGRIVADVYVGGRNVARILRHEGHAKPRGVGITGHSRAAHRVGR